MSSALASSCAHLVLFLLWTTLVCSWQQDPVGERTPRNVQGLLVVSMPSSQVRPAGPVLEALQVHRVGHTHSVRQV